MTTLQVYMVMYSTEITALAALLIGFGIGALVAYGHGRDKGINQGFDQGYLVGHYHKRDARGRYTR